MREAILVSFLIVAIVSLCLYAGYWYGSATERTKLAKYFREAIEETYNDGWNDGTANCELRCLVKHDVIL